MAPLKALFFLWVALSLICEGAMFAIFPTVCADIFGPILGARVYSFLFSAAGFTTILGFFLSKCFISRLGFHPFFYVAAAASFLGLLLLLLLRQETIQFLPGHTTDLRRLSFVSYRQTAPRIGPVLRLPILQSPVASPRSERGPQFAPHSTS